MSKDFKIPSQASKTPDNALRVNFDYREGNEKLFALTRGKYRVTVSAKYPQGIAPAKLPPYVRDAPYTNYRRIFPNVDASFTAYKDGIAENFILRSATSPSLTFLVKTESLKPIRMESEKRIVLFDRETREPVFAITDPIGSDTNNAIAPPLLCDMECMTANIFRFTLRLDDDWLKEKARLFPLTLYAQISWLAPEVRPLAEFEDFSGDDFLSTIGIHHYYAPQHGNTTMPAMKLGKGWRMNVIQAIRPIFTDGEVTAYIYQNELGEQTLLARTTQRLGPEDLLPLNYEEEDEHGHCDEYSSYVCYMQNPEGPTKYYYKSEDASLCYNPHLRILKKDGCRYTFDPLGWLSKITDATDRTTDILCRSGRVAAVGNGSGHYYRFHYNGQYLAAIVGPHNDWVQYRYCDHELSEVSYSDGRKLYFSKALETGREISVRFKSTGIT